jgi:RHS repeat-associated protein
LTAVERRSAGGIVLEASEYFYDMYNRRIGKTVGGEHLAIVYDGPHAWLDANQDGDVTQRYLYGPAYDGILARQDAAANLDWYLRDSQGSVRLLVADSGAILNEITYSAYGEILAQTNPAAADRFLYTGREFDLETGMYYYRARYYDPSIGRFIMQDPLGIASNDGNFYRYVFNSPTNLSDPSGLSPIVSYGSTNSYTKQEMAIIEQYERCVANAAARAAAFLASHPRLVGLLTIYNNIPNLEQYGLQQIPNGMEVETSVVSLVVMAAVLGCSFLKEPPIDGGFPPPPTPAPAPPPPGFLAPPKSPVPPPRNQFPDNYNPGAPNGRFYQRGGRGR